MTSDRKSKIIALPGKLVELQAQKFDELLASIDRLDDRKKEIWRNIYVQAHTDRLNAFTLFEKLYKVVTDDEDEMKSTEMAVHGKTLTSLLERMSRATDQLLKLADLVADEEEKKSKLDPKDAYTAIGELA